MGIDPDEIAAPDAAVQVTRLSPEAVRALRDAKRDAGLFAAEIAPAPAPAAPVLIPPKGMRKPRPKRVVVHNTGPRTEPVASPGAQLERATPTRAEAQEPARPRKLILSCDLPAGDVVTMTAAVRELGDQYRKQFLVDVRTNHPEIWEHNPWITAIADDDPEAERIRMHYGRPDGDDRPDIYASVQKSNQHPVHMISGYCEWLGRELGLEQPLRPWRFRGDVFLSQEERAWMSQVEEHFGFGQRFWLLNAGSKRDFTTKQWPHAHFQRVVDHFKGRVLFAQVGRKGDLHPELNGVYNLVGKTDLRQLIRLVYHASGVLTGVSLPMHLAAAVPRNPELPARFRPCVVVAGGREPVHWLQYPGHTVFHTIGQLPCCAGSSCWKARTVPLDDGDEKDRNLCKRPVARGEDSGSEIRPECMWMVTPEQVIDAVERYEAFPQ